MIRKSTGILLAFLVIAQSCVNLGLYTYYNLNKQTITEKLCVNKNKPGLHCNGHCFLAKQLKQAEEKEKQQSQNIKDKEDQVISIQEFYNLSYLPWFVETGQYSIAVNTYFLSDNQEILLPPKIAA